MLDDRVGGAGAAYNFMEGSSGTLHTSTHSSKELLGSSVNSSLNSGGATKMAMKHVGRGGKFFERHTCVPVYLPNIIGYLRIICTTISIALAFTHPKAMLAFYFISFVCDELDGRFARMFSQQSTYGAVLDMVTDRLSTAALLGILGVLYPSKAQVCILLQALDIGSHWCHMYASLVSGGTSHKVLSNHHNWLVRSYYSNRIFMGTCCVSCELLYLSLYAMHFSVFDEMSMQVDQHSLAGSAFCWLSAPFDSATGGAHHCAAKPEVSVFVLFAFISLPGFIIKQIINVIQLVQSMNGLWLHDLKNM